MSKGYVIFPEGKKIIKFYENEMSRMWLKKKLYTHNNDNVKVYQQKKLALSNLKELYEGYKTNKYNLKVRFSTFTVLKWKCFVFAGIFGTHSVCLPTT